jgi:hypothetical protein
MSCNCKKGAVTMLKGAAKLVRSELGLVILKDLDLIAARRRACEACDRWDHGRCRECGGCYTFAKSRLSREVCPLGRWPQIAGDTGQDANR